MDKEITRLAKSARGDVRITGLRKPSNPLEQDGKVILQGLSNVPDWKSISQYLKSAGSSLQQLSAAELDHICIVGFVAPDLVAEFPYLFVAIVEGDSTFDASAPGGLRISQFVLVSRDDLLRTYYLHTDMKRCAPGGPDIRITMDYNTRSVNHPTTTGDPHPTHLATLELSSWMMETLLWLLVLNLSFIGHFASQTRQVKPLSPFPQ
jgi:hypothetical protein